MYADDTALQFMYLTKVVETFIAKEYLQIQINQLLQVNKRCFSRLSWSYSLFSFIKLQSLCRDNR